MGKSRILSFAGCMMLLFLTACSKNQQYTPFDKICETNLEKAQLMQASEDVLRRMNFTVDKFDVPEGIIKTRPLTAAQWFEFWRSDNAGAFNQTEANLHTIRRIAELNTSQQNGQLCISCVVKTQRLNLPERQVSSTRAYEMFSESDSSTQSLKLNLQQKTDMSWVELGKDTELAAEILRRIEKQTAKSQ